jgi:hypothetical protein
MGRTALANVQPAKGTWEPWNSKPDITNCGRSELLPLFADQPVPEKSGRMWNQLALCLPVRQCWITSKAFDGGALER